MKRLIWLFVAGLLVVCGTASPAGINLIANGSFEQGTLGIGSFQGWQTDLGDISTFVDSSGLTGPDYGDAIDGLWAAYFGTTAADGGSSIWQTLATAPNQGYLLSFDLANDNGGLSSLKSFLVSAGNSTAFSFSGAADQNYVHYEFPFIASSGATEVEFSGANDNGYFELDNVVVASVPEPATSALLLLGAVAIGTAFRRSRHQAS